MSRSDADALVLRTIRDKPAPRRILQRRLFERHQIAAETSTKILGSLAARLMINNNRRGGSYVITTIGREWLAHIDRGGVEAPKMTVWQPNRPPPARAGAEDYKRVPSLFGPPAAVYSAHRRVV